MKSNKKHAIESMCISGITNILIVVKILVYKMCMHTAHAVKHSQVILSCDIPDVLDNMMVQGSTVEHN